MRERPSELVVIVQVDFGEIDLSARQEEFRSLVRSAGGRVVGEMLAKRSAPDPAHFVGKGKVSELASLVGATGSGLVAFNHDISPTQQRNLELLLQVRVLSRSELILDIFAQRARSSEGKLQVELAQLSYLATRLVRGWTHLERQRGGIGMRGPGEKQLETDRRLIGKRIALLKDRIRTLALQRSTRRRQRARGRDLNVSIVGYTNAGKSTLFNRLTKADSLVADRQFATLDTTTRAAYFGGNGKVLISDTVGFVRDLPHALVAAFHATLEESSFADLLIHVVDSSSDSRNEQIAAVNQVLVEVGADEVPQIVAFNQIDRSGLRAGIERDAYGKISKVCLSAATGEGVDNLRSLLADCVSERRQFSDVEPGALHGEC